MDLIKRKMELFKIVQQLCVENKRKTLANIDISSVLKTLK
jgi:histone H3/H4